MKQSIFIIIVIALLFGGFFLIYINNEEAPAPPATASGSAATTQTPTPEPNLLPDDMQQIKDYTGAVPLDTIPESYTVLVNGNYLLPEKYVPDDLTEPDVPFSTYDSSDKRKLRKKAARALEKMFGAAKKKKCTLVGISAYRSYARQKQIYHRNVSIYGKDTTNTFSAKPGSSEHQTGLTIDISCPQMNYLLSTSFANTKEGKWVKKNAHKYGYIVRYPEGTSKITGYRYEPWHIRYVGVPLATYLYKNKKTLEEYYGVSINGDESLAGIDVEDLKEWRSQ